WGKRSVMSILKNEIYTGTYYYNKTQGDTIIRDRSEWIGIPVSPIVPCELWEAAQKQRKANQNGSPRNTKHEYLMRGRLRCDACGHAFSCMSNSRNQHLKLYYYCAGQKSYYSPDNDTITCKHSLRAEQIDAAIWEGVKAILQNPQLILSDVYRK